MNDQEYRVTVHLHDFGSWVGASIQSQYIPKGVNRKGVRSLPTDYFSVRCDCPFPDMKGETDTWADLIYRDAWVDNRPAMTLRGKLILHAKGCRFAPATYGKLTNEYGIVVRTLEEVEAKERAEAQKAEEDERGHVQPDGFEPLKLTDPDTGEVIDDGKLPW